MVAEIPRQVSIGCISITRHHKKEGTLIKYNSAAMYDSACDYNFRVSSFAPLICFSNVLPCVDFFLQLDNLAMF